MDKIVSMGKQKVTEQGAKLVAMANDKNSPIGKGKEAIVKGGKQIVTAAVKGALK
eukprot:gene1180-15540_t